MQKGNMDISTTLGAVMVVSRYRLQYWQAENVDGRKYQIISIDFNIEIIEIIINDKLMESKTFVLEHWVGLN